jgi:hypothetical protein
MSDLPSSGGLDERLEAAYTEDLQSNLVGSGRTIAHDSWSYFLLAKTAWGLGTGAAGD